MRGRSAPRQGEPVTLRRHVPNALTVLRLVLAVAFPFLPRAAWLAVFAVSGLTEFLDGWLARRWGVISPFGQKLDPIADKAFLFSVAATLFGHGVIGVTELLLAGVRDIAVLVFLVALVLRGRLALASEIEPRWAGKITTTLQFALLVSYLGWGTAWPWLLWVTGAAGLVAAIDYGRAYVGLLRGAG